MRESVRREKNAPHRCGPRTRLGAVAALLCALLPGLSAGSAQAAGSLEITDLRTWSSPERTRLVLDLNGESSYRVQKTGGETHLVVDIRGAHNRTGKATWSGIDGRVRKVVMQATTEGIRVDVALAGDSPYKHFALSPYGRHKPHRIVLDVYAPRPGTKRPAPAPARTPAPRGRARPFVVVIDAGHGGEDPGAIGHYYHTREKDVVLQIARRLKREIDAIPGMRGKLTRRGDYFISLGGRIRKADALGGDLFVSVHADMSRDRHTRGTHVYTLAPKSARDRRAVRVARTENASDFVGGVEAAARFPMIFDGDGSPNDTVESRVLARLSLGRLREVNRSGREGRRSEARFWVLKGDRPSMLVETGFLSNRDDERGLRTAAFQDKLAQDLALAIRDYFEIRVKGGSLVHTVRSGETLSHIALRYGVGVGALASANRLGTKSVIRPGDRLLVPRSGWPDYRSAPPAEREPGPVVRPASYTVTRPAPAPAPAPRADGRHTVRRGENLTVIAQRHGIRLADLMRANGLNPRSRLWVGQVLKVPAPRPGDRAHTVRAGETLSGLAARYHVSLSRLAAVNDLRTRARLWVGQRLILPDVGPLPASIQAAPSAPAAPRTARVHTVRRGETLSGLADRYGVAQKDLARANGLGLWARLAVGQKLTVPGSAPVATASAAPAPPREHRVAWGESLSGLAQRYGVSLSALARANGLSTRAGLRVGQKLAIPGGTGPTVHVIREGESLSRIARLYDVSVDRIVSRNSLRNADRLMVGTELVIPR
jgi:N-acetylmuramoyl-L-alanine amidase